MKKTNEMVRPKEDVQLYRLFAIFGAAILGFAALRLINESRLMAFLVIGKWVALGLLVLNIAWLICRCAGKKTAEEDNVFTIGGISYFTISVFALLFAYQYLNNANVKVQIAFAFVCLFAVVYNIFKREFVQVSALAFLEATFLYFIGSPVYSVVEKGLRLISYIGAFLIPIVVLVGTLLALKNKQRHVVLAGHRIYSFSGKFEHTLMLVMGLVFLASSLLVTLVSSALTVVMIVLLSLYIIVGMICTIKLI